MAKTLFAIALTLGLMLTTSPTLAQPVPLPDDIKVVEPAQGTPPENARFSGRWNGVWGGGSGGSMPHILIIEEVTGDKAKLIYAWGPHSLATRVTPGWTRGEGAFSSGELKFQLKNGALVSYQYKDGELNGSYIHGRSLTGTFKKEPSQQ